MPALSEIDHHVLSNSIPITIWLVDVSSFHTTLSHNQVPDVTNIRMETFWRMLQRS